MPYILTNNYNISFSLKPLSRNITAPLTQGLCSRIDVIFDRYDRERGSCAGFQIKISNSSNPLPRQWQKFISNKKNKVNLSRFLSQEWIEMAKQKLATHQEFIVAGGLENPNLTVHVKDGIHKYVNDLESSCT